MVKAQKILVLKKQSYGFGLSKSDSRFNPETMTHEKATRLAANGFSSLFRWADRSESSNPGERIPELEGFQVGQVLYKKKPKKGGFDSKPHSVIRFEIHDPAGKELKSPIVVVRPSWANASFVEKTALPKMMEVYQLEDPSLPVPAITPKKEKPSEKVPLK